MRRKKQMLIPALVLTVMSLLATVTATYAWLGVSRIPFISDVSLTVITENGLYLAPDEGDRPGEWTTILDASAFFSDLVPLKPVTYTPGATPSPFSRVVYDSTGRTDGVTPLAADNYNVRYVTADRTSAEDSSAEANGYMVAMDFWMTSGTQVDVCLTEPINTVDDQMGGGTYVVGEPVWDEGIQGNVNGGNGLESTIRMAFAFTPTDNETYEPNGETTLVLYEPNADKNADGSTEYRQTMSAVLNALPLQGDSRIIRQHATTWTDLSPAMQGEVEYHVGSFFAEDDTALLSLDKNQLVRVTLYIWMEGQDSDCIARYVHNAASILANIQFNGSAEEIGTGIIRPDRDSGN